MGEMAVFLPRFVRDNFFNSFLEEKKGVGVGNGQSPRLGEGFINGTGLSAHHSTDFWWGFDFARFVDYPLVFYTGCSGHEQSSVCVLFSTCDLFVPGGGGLSFDHMC